MFSRLTDRINAALERHLPEQRLFLKSDQGMRFVRLKPGTQATIILGGALFVGWTAIVTSIFLIDTISAGSARDQAEREQLAYRTRLNQMSEQRDANLAAAHQAQSRFAVAMQEVSDMQSRLLASEERRRELETAVDVIQTTLRRTMSERDAAREEAEQYRAEIESETGESFSAASRQRDLEATLEMLTAALSDAALERDGASAAEHEAYAMVDQLQFEADLARERNQRIFSQIEDAVAMSMEPLQDMFDATGLPTDQILRQVREGYSGQGGPLMPITMSTRGEAPDEISVRANEVLGALDELNVYRMAAQQIPLSIPVNGGFRYTSGFGYRTDPINGGRRMHSGTDFAGSSGTPIVATAEGTVVFAGRQSGYGNVIEIRHAFGVMTRYAHLSRIRVSEGERVSRGERIGDMGSTGRSTGTHLHYEVHVDDEPVNPMTFIRAGQDVF
ncbi:peptidoglycan DD-metalloendopeptidase family protein [Rhodobacterales bacterium HKCCE2091]|nr:peptidoglycan DD-metalloendopeptidase family protein [Rhodobacterales bacterium HKCCE2091]